MIKQTILSLTTLTLLTVSSLAVDLTTCIGCHGQKFEKPAMGISKIVQEMKKEEIQLALKEYKHGSHGGSMQEVMKKQIAKFTDKEINEIVTIITSNEINITKQSKKDIKTTTQSIEINIDSCIGCHGEHFEKSAMGYSRIVNEMSKEDIIASMNGYKDGTYGKNMKALMATQAMKLSTQEIEAIAKMIAQAQ